MVLALQHGSLPATLHAGEPSPRVDWSTGAVELLTGARPWDGAGRVRRAGVSAFGLSGTNAHVIIADAGSDPAESEIDEPEAPAAAPVLPGAPAWLVSGRSAPALAAQAGRLHGFLRARPDEPVTDVAWSLATTRSGFEHRAVVRGAGRDELVAGLAALADGRSAPGVVTGGVPGAGPGRVGFLFAGQGSQRAGMGRGLYAASPVFAEAFDQVSGLLEAELGFSVAEVVLAGSEDDERADQTLYAQTGLFAVEVALVAVLAAAGIRPDAVAGHSVGEIAAAHAAGVLSLTDAVRLVAARARLMQALPEGGAMAAIAASEEEILEDLPEDVSLAAVNGPGSVVVSGETEAVDRLVETWRGRERRVRRLRVSHAFHSARMDPALDELARVAAGLEYREPTVPWAGALTGELVERCVPGYWSGQAREAVRFADALRALADREVTTFLEIGPDATLCAMGTGALPDPGTEFIPALRPDEDAAGSVLAALSRAHVRGLPVDWTAVLDRGETVELPTYAFQQRRLWPEPEPAEAPGGGSAEETGFWAAVQGGDVAGLAGTLDLEPGRLGEVLPALAAWRRRERDDSTVADWRYRIAWTPVTDPGAASLSGTWLLVTDDPDAPLARDCADALTARGAEVDTRRPEPGHTDRAALAALLPSPEDRPFAGVLSLLAVADPSDTPAGRTLALAQALGDAGIDAPLWVLTRGAVATTTGEPADPAQAAAWGLGRVVGLEHPERWGGLVDLPPAWDDRTAGRLAAVLAAGELDQVALRPAGVLARRLHRAPAAARPRTPWCPAGTVLVTGGTGFIGGRAAALLAGRGAPRVVLTGRSGPRPALAGTAAGLAASGTDVEVLACDAAERDQVAGLLAHLAAGGPPLRAVVHAAGVGQATAVADTSPAEHAGITGAKVDGARALDELTAGLELERFVVFSSIAATWGSGRQPSYAAANACLDALAEDRRARGLAATSVAWGLWGGGGMGGGEAGEQLQRFGLTPMDPDAATRALAQVLDGAEDAVTVAGIDWDRFAPTFTLRRPSPLIEELPEARRALSAGAEQAAGPGSDGGAGLAARLAELAAPEQDRVLTELVRTEAAAVLGHTGPDTVDPDRAFKDLGFDSLTAVELRNRLAGATGLTLPPTLVFDYPTPVALAGHLRTTGFGMGENPIPVLAELDSLESALSAPAPDEDTHELVSGRLKELLAKWSENAPDGRRKQVAKQIESATDDEMLDFIHRELGRS
jgi:acyl transferase domain-containing protein